MISGFAVTMRSSGDCPRWAEPHYLESQGLMPAGTVVVYTPKDVEELAICSVLFSESYRN